MNFVSVCVREREKERAEMAANLIIWSNFILFHLKITFKLAWYCFDEFINVSSNSKFSLLTRIGFYFAKDFFRSSGSLGKVYCQPVHSKGDQPWVFFGRDDAKAETPVFWPPHAKTWLIGKDSDAGRDWGQEEKGTTEDEMAGWHHQLSECEFEWTPGGGNGQGGLACCDSWGRKESDTTERLNWTELKWTTALYKAACAMLWTHEPSVVMVISLPKHLASDKHQLLTFRAGKNPWPIFFFFFKS